MRRTALSLLFLAPFLAAACRSVPVTGRRQLALMAEADELALGRQAWAELMKKERPSPDEAKQALLRKVGLRVADAAAKPGYEWEFVLLEGDQTVNAFCLPGGKVAFYTGIWAVAQDEAGLAVVMGHEVAHALARHGAERMSQGKLARIGGVALDILLGGRDPVSRDLYSQAYGLGVGMGVMLPFSRGHESEADHIGLVLMAKAGYDPRAAVGFWQRMSAAAGGEGSPLGRYLSTHPSGRKRIDDIQGWLPEALPEYERARAAP